MWSLFWPEYACNTTSQVLVTEEDFPDTSEVTYVEGSEIEYEPEPMPA